MDFITKMTDEDIKKANEKFYNVIIGDPFTGHLHLELSRVEFDSINVFLFVELGFNVTIEKIDKCIKL